MWCEVWGVWGVGVRHVVRSAWCVVLDCHRELDTPPPSTLIFDSRSVRTRITVFTGSDSTAPATGDAENLKTETKRAERRRVRWNMHGRRWLQRQVGRRYSGGGNPPYTRGTFRGYLDETRRLPPQERRALPRRCWSESRRKTRNSLRTTRRGLLG